MPMFLTLHIKFFYELISAKSLFLSPAWILSLPIVFLYFYGWLIFTLFSSFISNLLYDSVVSGCYKGYGRNATNINCENQLQNMQFLQLHDLKFVCI